VKLFRRRGQTIPNLFYRDRPIGQKIKTVQRTNATERLVASWGIADKSERMLQPLFTKDREAAAYIEATLSSKSYGQF